MPSSINRQLRQKGLVPDEITFHLKFQEEEVQYHCLRCCKGIFRQQARILNVFMAGEPDVSEIRMVSTSIQCSRCGTLYHIETLNM